MADTAEKIVVLTGGTRGMGRAMLDSFSELGWRIVFVARDKKRGQAVLKEFSSRGYPVHMKIADLSQARAVEGVCAEIRREFARVDVLVNNAGTVLDGFSDRISTLDIALLKKTLDINFIAPVIMCRGLLPVLLKSASGRIINISSGAGSLSAARQVYFPAYSMSKTALNALTKNLAYENPRLKVFSVDPGWVRTELGGEDAPLSISEGIDTAVYLATTPGENLVSGALYCQREVVSW